MRYVMFFIGLILLAKGAKECVALPRALLPLLHAGSVHAAAHASAMVVGTLAVLAGAVVLLARAWLDRRATSAAIAR